MQNVISHRPSRPSKPWILRVMVALMVMATLPMILSGCAAMRASAARQRVIQDRTAVHIYQGAITEPWAGARQILFQQGYQVRDSESGEVRSLETEWQIQQETRVRYLVQGINVDGGHKVHFTKNEQRIGETSIRSSRDHNMEWLLLQRVDPAAAADIQAEAEQHAQAALAQ